MVLKKKGSVSTYDILRKDRAVWAINPITRVSRDEAKYHRQLEKMRIRKEVNRHDAD